MNYQKFSSDPLGKLSEDDMAGNAFTSGQKNLTGITFAISLAPASNVSNWYTPDRIE